MTSLIKVQFDIAQQLYNESEKTYKFTLYSFVFLILFCTVLGFALSKAIIDSVVKPVKKVTRKLEEISRNGGNLTQRIGINSDDEVGQLSKAFDGFMQKLQLMIKEVAGTAKAIASSREVALIITDLNQSSQKIGEIVQLITGISD